MYTIIVILWVCPVCNFSVVYASNQLYLRGYQTYRIGTTLRYTIGTVDELMC